MSNQRLKDLESFELFRYQYNIKDLDNFGKYFYIKFYFEL